MANLKAGYRFSPKLQVTLDVLNLFDKHSQRHRILGRRLHPQRNAGRQLQRRHRRQAGASAGTAHPVSC
jgi:outer membrane receptor protein involved in Fe transport